MQDTVPIDRGRQQRALWMSTTAFTACFAVWTIFSIIGIEVQRQLGLSETQFGLLIGMPILTGSLIRLILGIWADQHGGRLVQVLVMLAASVATWMLTYADSYATFLLAAVGVGIAGGAFSVGVAYVSRWFPMGRQGLALGIFGAGNVGAAVTKLFAPMVMVALGWKAVAQYWAIGLAVMAVIFWLTTADDPEHEKRRREGIKPQSLASMLEPLKSVQVWRFSLYYFFVFGGFVALSLWLPRYLIGVYGMDIRTAGMVAAAYSIPASLFRVKGVSRNRVMPRKMCALYTQPTGATSSAAPPRKVTMRCAHSASIIITPPSMWWVDSTMEYRPSSSCTNSSSRIAVSPKVPVAFTRGLNRRRTVRMLIPTRQTTPNTPPATIARSCFCGAVRKGSYSACGVSRPTRWPPRIASTPMWKRLLPQRMPLSERSWLEPVRQVNMARSKRSQLPMKKTASAM